MFMFVIIFSVFRGMRKTQIYENAIVSTDFVIEWTDVKNKNARLKILRSEIDIVDGIFKQSLF